MAGSSFDHDCRPHALCLAAAQEECEDGEGNVYDRRTYEDLKKQGLI
jgi:hypothetical protein